MKKSPLHISNLSKTLTNDGFNNNFDFINQNYSNLFDRDINYVDNKYENYVKVKYLKGKR